MLTPECETWPVSPHAITRRAVVDRRGSDLWRRATDSRDIECDLLSRHQQTRSVQWGGKLGFGRPDENVINTDFSYTSVSLKPQNWDTFAGTGFFVMRDPAGGFPNRIGGVIKLEQGLWIAFLGGRFADYPPREMHEFAAWARSLHNPIMADLIATAEPVSAPSSFRFPRSIRRLFGRMQAFPDGLLPFGVPSCISIDLRTRHVVCLPASARFASSKCGKMPAVA
jgi:hypothetical protein